MATTRTTTARDGPAADARERAIARQVLLEADRSGARVLGEPAGEEVPIWGRCFVVVVVMAPPRTSSVGLGRAFRCHAHLGQRATQDPRLVREAGVDASELLGNARVVQSFGQEPHEAGRFDRAAHELALASVGAARARAKLPPGADLVLAIDLAVVMVPGTALVAAHQMSLGVFFAFLAYLATGAGVVQAGQHPGAGRREFRADHGTARGAAR